MTSGIENLPREVISYFLSSWCSVIDEQNCVVFTNERIEDLTGAKVEEVISRPLIQWISPVFQEALLNFFSYLREQQPVEIKEYRFHFLEGQEGILVRCKALGLRIACSEMSVDLLTLAMQNSSSHFFLEIDSEDRIIDLFEKGTYKALAYHREDLLGKIRSDFSVEERVKNPSVLHYRRKGGEMIPIQSEVLSVEGGKKIEIGTMYAPELMNALKSARNDIVWAIAHDVRQPCQIIDNAFNLLLEILSEDEPNYEDLEKILELSNHETRVLENLVEQFLLFEKLYFGEFADIYSKLSPFSLFDTFRKTTELLRSCAEKEGIHFHREIIDTGYTVLGHPEFMIDRLMNNLVGNAIKVLREVTHQKIIRVGMDVGEVVEGKVLVEIYVEDNGPGIPREKQELIFQPFYQIKRSPSSREADVGLGLALCRSIVNGFGGEIGVDSTLEMGSKFKYSFELEVV